MANIIETAVAAGTFTTLAKALEVAGLIETLEGPGPFTVFAPNDAAFAKIDSAKLTEILGNKEVLTAILTYHVLAGKYEAKDVLGLSTATTVQGEDVEFHVDGDTVKVDGAHIIGTDIVADNGIIHVIDTVIVPEAASLVAQD